MRAIFLRDNEPLEDLIISDDRSHHLIKSCRIRKDETVKVLDGRGTSYLYNVHSILRKDIHLKFVKEITEEKKINIDLMIGLPKKDAFELAVKNATEMGISKIIPWESDYSNWSIKNLDRIKTIVESAMIQSNNPFNVEIDEPIKKDDFVSVINNYDLIVLASLKNTKEFPRLIDPTKKILIIIGPEGGLSEIEENSILAQKNVAPLQLPTYILRAPNAVTAVTAFTCSRFDG